MSVKVRCVRAGRSIVCESYVDEDAIDALNDQLAALAKMDRSAVTLSNFDARYRVPGGLEVANIQNNGSRVGEVLAVQELWPSGEIVWSRAHVTAGRIEEVRRLVASAKDTIAQAKQKENPDQSK